MKLPAVRMARSRKGFLIALAASLCLGVRAQAPSGPVFTNSLGMELLRMGPATFVMGIGADPKLADTDGLAYDEQPAHQVALSRAFYILRAKVAQGHYARSGLPGSAADASWEQAAAFCGWLSRRVGVCV
jgi:formylglycine-generating enzyme required for sulfatase activity